MVEMILVCKDHYGQPNQDTTACFYINPNFIIKVWKETRMERKWGTEFECEERTYYMGELSLGNQTQTFHFLHIQDYDKVVNRNGIHK